MVYDEQMARYGFVPFNHLVPIEFSVSMNGIYDAKGRRIPGHSAVVRDDTGDTLAVHSAQYKLVPYQEHFHAFEEAIRKSQLRWDTMHVGTDMQDNGAKIFRQYLFPDHMVKFDSGRGLREVALRIFMFDSYDGSTRFQGRCGAFDFICCNSAVSGKEIDAVGFKHVGDMATKISLAAERLTGAAERFIEEMERLQRWPRIPMRTIEFSELLNDLPQANPRLVDQLTADYSRGEGNNLWDVHNLLTSWATHDIPAKTQADRQKRVAALVEGELWTGLERSEPSHAG